MTCNPSPPLSRRRRSEAETDARLSAPAQTLYGGVKTGELLGLPPCPAPKHEYGNLACTVELVGGMQQAIDHIHEFGSSHTECIVTEDAARASEFLQRVVRATRVRESRRLE